MTAVRGEIWFAELSPTRGSEQSGVRPVLVVQNNAINRFKTTVLAIPLTTNMRRAALPSCVAVAAGEGGLPEASVLLCHQLRALDVNRLRNKVGDVSADTLQMAARCLLFTLGISLVGVSLTSSIPSTDAAASDE